MFWQIFYLLPFYATDVLHFEQFELLETVDAWCIIFFSVLMASLFKKWKPFSAMMLGFVLASVSWLIIGVWGTTSAVVLGVALYAIGEATQAPRFYEYVSSLAPPSQVGTYMGFAFLPVAIGSFTAGPLSDMLRLGYLNTNPAMMWYILTAIGVVTTTLLYLYNMFLVKK
jgi:dipeptide/tripeptide permease